MVSAQIVTEIFQEHYFPLTHTIACMRLSVRILLFNRLSLQQLIMIDDGLLREREYLTSLTVCITLSQWYNFATNVVVLNTFIIIPVSYREVLFVVCQFSFISLAVSIGTSCALAILAYSYKCVLTVIFLLSLIL